MRTTAVPRGRVVWETIESRVLRGNRPGDPVARRIAVWLPPGYDGKPERVPLLLGLAAYGGDPAGFLHTSPWGEPLDARLERLLAAGRIGPMVVALPDCFTRYGGSQYVDSSATGRYATHVVHEVVPYLESRFRILRGARHRGLFGKSSGGYGALTLAVHHPGVFGAVACHSGDMGFEYCYLPDFPKFLGEIERCGGVAAFLRAFDAAPRKRGEMVAAMNVLAMAACYGPNPRRKPLGIDLPMDLGTGALRPGSWERWLEFDPVRLARRRPAALRRLRLLFFDCGRRDEYNLLWGARQLASILAARRIAHIYEEFDDGHRDLSYRFDRSLPLLWEALRPAPGVHASALRRRRRSGAEPRRIGRSRRTTAGIRRPRSATARPRGRGRRLASAGGTPLYC